MLVSEYNCTYFLSSILPLNVFLIFTFALLCIFVVLFLTDIPKSKVALGGFLLLIGGGLLNLWQRILSGGCVYDYINFFGLFTFNIPDVMVDLGTVMLIFILVKRKDDKHT